MSDVSNVRALIERQSRLFEDNYNAGDAERLVTDYFANDADQPTAFPPGGQQPVRGRANLIAMFSGMLAQVPRIQLETVEIIASDTIAHEVGRSFLTTADGSEIVGRYTVGWINCSGGWRAKTDFFAEDGWDG